MKLKIRVLASIMSILTLSSFSQLTGFAKDTVKDDKPTPFSEHPVYAKTKENTDLNTLAIAKVQKCMDNVDKDDSGQLKTIEKFIAAFGPNMLNEFIKNQYNIKVTFGSMISIIDEISDDAQITKWDCKENKITIENSDAYDINAHIGIDFDDECGIKDITLANCDTVSDIAIPKGQTVDSDLLLSGGNIEINANIINQIYQAKEQGIKIGDAKVYITSESFIQSFKEAANELKDYASNTNQNAKRSINKDIIETSEQLLNTANNLAETVEGVPAEYHNKVDDLIKYLKEHNGRVNGLNVLLCVSNKDFNDNVSEFVNLNKQLTEKVVNALANKPVVVDPQPQPPAQQPVEEEKEPDGPTLEDEKKSDSNGNDRINGYQD